MKDNENGAAPRPRSLWPWSIDVERESQEIETDQILRDKEEKSRRVPLAQTSVGSARQIVDQRVKID